MSAVAERGLGEADRATHGSTPVERLEALYDPGTLRLVRTAVRDGVVAGSGQVDGRPVLAYAQDSTLRGGSLGAAHAEVICEVLRLADRGGRPVVGFVSSAGARLQEGLAALAGYGAIFAAMTRLSGRVPQISVVSGMSAGGGAYAPALGDVTIMTQGASMFLTGPGVVREVTGEDVSAEELGGSRAQAAGGVCHMVAPDDRAAAELVRRLLGHLPSSAEHPLPLAPSREPLPRDPGEAVPEDPRRVYDVREVLRRLVDGGELLAFGERWARNVACEWARIGGRPVGIVANQPRHLGGVLDAAAAEKAAGFVERCNSFGVPLLAVVDTPGFLPGAAQERAAVIRHGASLVRAFAGASVPKLSVVLRKSFGGAHIAMNSKQLGADLVLAWPRATLGVMGADQAVGIVHRRRLAAVAEPARERRSLAAEYAAEHLTAERAAAGAWVDEVVAPADTRERLMSAYELLGGEG